MASSCLQMGREYRRNRLALTIRGRHGPVPIIIPTVTDVWMLPLGNRGIALFPQWAANLVPRDVSIYTSLKALE